MFRRRSNPLSSGSGLAGGEDNDNDNAGSGNHGVGGQSGSGSNSGMMSSRSYDGYGYGYDNDDDDDDDDRINPEIEQMLYQQIHYATNLDDLNAGADEKKRRKDKTKATSSRAKRSRHSEAASEASEAAEESTTSAAGLPSLSPGSEPDKRRKTHARSDVSDSASVYIPTDAREDADALFIIDKEASDDVEYVGSGSSSSDNSDSDSDSGDSDADSISGSDKDGDTTAATARSSSSSSSSSSSKKPSKRKFNRTDFDDEDFDFNELVTRARVANEAARNAEFDKFTGGLFSAFSKNIEQQMSRLVNPALWKIDEDDAKTAIASTRSTMGRYYISFDASSIRCHNCDERGHISRDCPNKRKVSPCYFCGETGHQRFRCPKQVCYSCLGVGHFRKQCRKQPARPGYFCRGCSMKGHFEVNCSNLWRRYHSGHALERSPEGCREFLGFPFLLTSNSMALCAFEPYNPTHPTKKSGGNKSSDSQAAQALVAPDSLADSAMGSLADSAFFTSTDVQLKCSAFLHSDKPKVFCYNCAGSGHYGFECFKERFDPYSQPLTPFPKGQAHDALSPSEDRLAEDDKDDTSILDEKKSLKEKAQWKYEKGKRSKADWGGNSHGSSFDTHDRYDSYSSGYSHNNSSGHSYSHSYSHSHSHNKSASRYAPSSFSSSSYSRHGDRYENNSGFDRGGRHEPNGSRRVKDYQPRESTREAPASSQRKSNYFEASDEVEKTSQREVDLDDDRAERKGRKPSKPSKVSKYVAETRELIADVKKLEHKPPSISPNWEKLRSEQRAGGGGASSSDQGAGGQDTSGAISNNNSSGSSETSSKPSSKPTPRFKGGYSFPK